MFGLLVRKTRMFNFNAQLRVISIAGAIALFLAAPTIGKAAECSIKADGETVYARVQEILKKNIIKTPDLGFAPYDEINIKLLPGCVFQLDGKFHVKKKGKINFKRFEAEFVRQGGAPKGFKKLKLITD